MQMTDNEIVRSYQHAKNRTKQISILAELNACSKAEIRDILEKNGEEVPHYGNRYTGKVKEVTEASGSKRKRSSVRMSERKKKSDSSKMSARLLKSEETEDVGMCQQDVGTMSEDPDKRMFGESLEAKKAAPTCCQPAEPVDVWKPEEMLKARSPEVPEEVIVITMLKINDLKSDMGAIQEEMDKLQTELQDKVKICNRLSVWLDEVKKEGET